MNAIATSETLQSVFIEDLHVLYSCGWEVLIEWCTSTSLSHDSFIRMLPQSPSSSFTLCPVNHQTQSDKLWVHIQYNNQCKPQHLLLLADPVLHVKWPGNEARITHTGRENIYRNMSSVSQKWLFPLLSVAFFGFFLKFVIIDIIHYSVV